MKSTVFNKIIFCVMSFFFVVNLSYARGPLWEFIPLNFQGWIVYADPVVLPHQTLSLEYRVESRLGELLRLGRDVSAYSRVTYLGSCLREAIDPYGSCSLTLSVNLDGLKAGESLRVHPSLCRDRNPYQCYQASQHVTIYIL